VNKSNAMTAAIVVLAAVIPYLISQQDVDVPPLVKVILTALNIGLLAYARLSGTTSIPVAEVSSPVQTPAGDTATVTATTPDKIAPRQ
jgi:hypothetical protein